jgi:hypothetical protein
MTAVEQVELTDTVEATCQFGCPFWRHHDRNAGDNGSPDLEVRAHVADTGHTVTVTEFHRRVTEYREADVFTDLTGQRDERGAA